MKLSRWLAGGAAAVGLVAVVGGVVVARTLQNAQAGAQDFRAFGAGLFNRSVIGQLGLSDDQRSQIRSIIHAERASYAPLLADAHTSAEDLRAAVRAGDSDSQLQTLATKQADADLALIATAQKTQAKIAAILTPQQRATAQQLFDSRIERIQAHMAENAAGTPMVDKLADRLGLSDSQKVQVHQIVAAARTSIQPEAGQLIANLKSTEDSIAAGTFDPGSADTNAMRSESALSSVVLTGAKTRAQLLAVLTPDQRSQLSQMMAEGRHNWRSRHAS